MAKIFGVDVGDNEMWKPTTIEIKPMTKERFLKLMDWSCHEPFCQKRFGRKCKNHIERPD